MTASTRPGLAWRLGGSRAPPSTPAVITALALAALLASATALSASTILLTGASLNAPITPSTSTPTVIKSTSVTAYLDTSAYTFLLPNTWTLIGTGTTYSGAEETTAQYYTVVEYGSAELSGGYPTGLTSVSGSTAVEIGKSQSVSGTGFVASAFFSPSAGVSQYYLHCDAAASASSTAYFAFIISNGTYTWVGFTSASLGTSITQVTMTGPSTYWVAGDYVYACAAYDSSGFSQVGTVQISAGTTSEGTSTTPSSTWYPLNPAPTLLDWGVQWWTTRATGLSEAGAGSGELLWSGSGGGTALLANPTPPTLLLTLINLGAAPTAAVNGTSVSLGTTYYVIGSNMRVTVTPPNANTAYTGEASSVAIGGGLSGEVVGAAGSNYYAGPGILPPNTNLEEESITPTPLGPPSIYYSFTATLSVNSTVNWSIGETGTAPIHLYFPPSHTETIQAKNTQAYSYIAGVPLNALYSPNAYSSVSVSGNSSLLLPIAFTYLGYNSASGVIIGGGGSGYIGPSLLSSLSGLARVSLSPAAPPAAAASINGLSISIPSVGPFNLYLGEAGSLSLTWSGNNTYPYFGYDTTPTNDAPSIYEMNDINGYAPLYYMANQCGGVTMIIRMWLPNPPTPGVIIDGFNPGWSPFIYLASGDVFVVDHSNGNFGLAASISGGWNDVVFMEWRSGSTYYLEGWLNGTNLGTTSTQNTPQLFAVNFPDYIGGGAWFGWPYWTGSSITGFSGMIQYAAFYCGALPSSSLGAYFETGVLPLTPYILYTGDSLVGGTWVDLMGHSNATAVNSAALPAVYPSTSLSLTVEAGHNTTVNFPPLPSVGVGPLINSTAFPAPTQVHALGGFLEPLTLTTGPHSLSLGWSAWLGSSPVRVLAGGSLTMSSPYLVGSGGAAPQGSPLYWAPSTAPGTTAPAVLVENAGTAPPTLTPTALVMHGPQAPPGSPASLPLTVNGSTAPLLINGSLIYVESGLRGAVSAPPVTYWVQASPTGPALIGGGGVINVGLGSTLYLGPPGSTATIAARVMNASSGSLAQVTVTAPVSFIYMNGTQLPPTSFTFNAVDLGALNGFAVVGGTRVVPTLMLQGGVHWIATAVRGGTSPALLYVTESDTTTGFETGSTLIGAVSGYWGPPVWLNATLTSGVQQGQYASATLNYPRGLEGTFASFTALNPGTTAQSSVTAQLDPTIYLTLGGSTGSAPGVTVTAVVSTAPPPALPVSPIPLAIHFNTVTGIVVYGAVVAMVVLFVKKGEGLSSGLIMAGATLLITGLVLGTAGLYVPGAVITVIGVGAGLAARGGQGGGGP